MKKQKDYKETYVVESTAKRVWTMVTDAIAIVLLVILLAALIRFSGRVYDLDRKAYMYNDGATIVTLTYETGEWEVRDVDIYDKIIDCISDGYYRNTKHPWLLEMLGD